MEQTLNIEIPIPEEYQIIDRTDLENLINNQLIGKVWGMKELEKHVGRSNDWLKENLLYPHREELDALNGGFVTYPTKQGQRWRFGALKMSNWLEENLEKIM
jgi:phage pi2 protein 07